jgi:hypothetical protein
VREGGRRDRGGEKEPVRVKDTAAMRRMARVFRIFSTPANTQEVTGDGQHKTVEDLVKAKGEKVTRGRVNFDGDIEYAPE